MAIIEHTHQINNLSVCGHTWHVEVEVEVQVHTAQLHVQYTGGYGCVYSNLQYSLYTEKYKKLKLKVEINFFLLYPGIVVIWLLLLVLY